MIEAAIDVVAVVLGVTVSLLLVYATINNL
jgi:hypothetical protein